jgi:hypothetical protein
LIKSKRATIGWSNYDVSNANLFVDSRIFARPFAVFTKLWLLPALFHFLKTLVLFFYIYYYYELCCNDWQWFFQAQSDNLPKIDAAMMASFIAGNSTEYWALNFEVLKQKGLKNIFYTLSCYTYFNIINNVRQKLG